MRQNDYYGDGAAPGAGIALLVSVALVLAAIAAITWTLLS